LGSPGPKHCKVCGSTSIRSDNITEGRDKAGRAWQIPTPLGGFGLTPGDKYTQTRTYQAFVCNVCLNIQQIHNSITYGPIILKSTIGDMWVVIPYSLSLILKDLKYIESEIKDLIFNLYRKLEDVRDRFRKDGGRNRCEDGRLGRKTEIRLKDKSKLQCWIIVDEEREKMAFRLSFGSKEGICR
jgi:hypothetical protein